MAADTRIASALAEHGAEQSGESGTWRSVIPKWLKHEGKNSWRQIGTQSSPNIHGARLHNFHQEIV